MVKGVVVIVTGERFVYFLQNDLERLISCVKDKRGISTQGEELGECRQLGRWRKAFQGRPVGTCVGEDVEKPRVSTNVNID